MKKCATCKGEKPLIAFGKKRDTPDGYAYSCKACSNKKAKQLRKDKMDKKDDFFNTFL